MSQNISNLGRNISTYQYNPYIQQQQQSFSAGTPVSNGKVVESNPLLNAATSTPDNPAKMLAAMGFSAAALIPLNNVINKPLIEKEYEKTFFAKIEKYIDKHLSSKSWVKNLNKKAENFANLFLEPYEGNEEVIFDVQYKNPERHQQGYQTVAAPGYPGVGSDYGWGFSNPSQMLVDAFEMQDGTSFDWNDPEKAAHPYENRDARFYASILYDGAVWKDSTLSLSTNRYVWDENDRRNTWYSVTERGEKIASQAMDAMRNAIDNLFAKISKADEVALTGAMKTINSILARMELTNA